MGDKNAQLLRWPMVQHKSKRNDGNWRNKCRSKNGCHNQCFSNLKHQCASVPSVPEKIPAALERRGIQSRGDAHFLKGNCDQGLADLSKAWKKGRGVRLK
jgi:hypothetical protein